MQLAGHDSGTAGNVLQAVANLFPEAFGLDRHRVRLRAGASEKLKLSFLPFQLPPLQQSEAAAPGKPPVLKGLKHSLLVLSDSECGEFAYELCGEVVLPGSFMEHKATVGLEGTQVRDTCQPHPSCYASLHMMLCMHLQGSKQPTSL